MVETIQRDKNDLFKYQWGAKIFKNPRTLRWLRISALALFLYALLYGFLYPDKAHNHFTTAVFWSFFWPFFMFLSLPTLGAYFCSICPLAFVGKRLKKMRKQGTKMPKWLKNPYISLGIVLMVYWGLFYMFPALFSQPYVVALFYSFFTLLAFAFYFIFADMSYCAYICPISAIRNAFSRDSFMWLGSYESACRTCTTFECAKACEFGQSPFNFDKNNSMGDCTLCMDCANSCAAISYKAKRAGFSLLKPIRKARNVDVWTYLLLFAFMTLTLKFMAVWNHAPGGEMLPWMWLTHGFSQAYPRSPVRFEALFTLLFSVGITLLLAGVGFRMAARTLKENRSRIFREVGYAYAPLALIASLGVAGESFFTRYFHSVINGFIEAFHLPFHFIAPLATPQTPWLHIFVLFDYLAVGWTLFLLWKRITLFAPEKPVSKRLIATLWLSLLPVFYLGLTFFA